MEILEEMKGKEDKTNMQMKSTHISIPYLTPTPFKLTISFPDLPFFPSALPCPSSSRVSSYSSASVMSCYSQASTTSSLSLA